MNWFWFALIALICWSGSDLFSKIGCCGEKDKTAHLKMVVAVGLVMGLHAAYMIVFHHVSVTWDVVWTYLPVSLLYILSMTLGYVGLRYIELSISSPICNSSGALVAVLCLCTGALSDYNGPQKAVILCAVGLVCLGVVGLGVVEAREDDDLRRRRQEHANRKYAKSWLAICLPVAYCLLDAAGTFADSLVLERLNEDSANVAYELTFLAAGIGCLVYLLARREKFTFKADQVPRRHPEGRHAHLARDHRADPAPEGGASGQSQPAPAHRRGARRAEHLRRERPDRRDRHAAAGKARALRGALVRHSLACGRKRVQKARGEHHVRAALPDQKALSPLKHPRGRPAPSPGLRFFRILNRFCLTNTAQGWYIRKAECGTTSVGVVQW